MDVPTWLNSDYVETIWRKAEKDDSIEVSGITITPATAKGDNYMSDMHRILVKFSRDVNGRQVTGTRSLIAKIAIASGIQAKMTEDGRFFETETSMMSETLPRMREILSSHGVPASLSARCLPTEEKEPIHLFLEDLAVEGFRLANGQAGLDLDHCLIAIRNLANFHASSVALAEKDLSAVTQYNKGIFGNDHKIYAPYYEENVKNFAEKIAEWRELSPRIYEKMLKFSEVPWEKLCKIACFRKNDFNVLNHGDFWRNNLMFRYDDQHNPVDSRFVDFQVSHYGSPAIDILYFFGASTSDEVRQQHRELIVREYHTSLIATMAKLNCSTVAPSLDQLLDTLRERAVCEVVASFTVLPLALVDKSNVVSLDGTMKGGEHASSMYQGQLFRKVMGRIIPLYDSMGLLDTTGTR